MPYKQCAFYFVHVGINRYFCHMNFKVFLFTLAISISSAFAWEIPADSVRQAAMQRLAASPGVDSTQMALLITDLRTGERLVEYHADRPLIPASIMKSITIATLLQEKGPDYVYTTPIYTTGSVRHGILEGNIVVAGSGDPSIASVKGPKSADIIQEITQALKKENIDSIAGRIIIDNDIFSGPDYPASWGSGDLKNAYGTPSHGFNFENNASGKAAVHNPASTFTTRLLKSLSSAGIKYGNNSIEQGKRHLLAAHVSAPLEEIMRSCMMRSDNLFAECFLRTYSAERRHDGSTASGAQLEADYWKHEKMPMENIKIIDGSGLSRSNRLTPDFATGVLANMADDVEYASFFPLAGQEGTLRKFMAGTTLDSYLAMKTGSMTGIQSYAGYMLDDNFAPTHTVVIITNNLKNRDRFRTDFADLLLTIFAK